MTYRQKSCKFCGTTHKKRGPYCGKVCSNKDRTLTPLTKSKISHTKSVEMRTPEAQERNWEQQERMKLRNLSRDTVIPEEIVQDPEELYLPPIKTDQPDGTFVAGGDLWREID